MIDGLEPIYSQIGNAINEQISQEWVSARVEAIFYSGNIDYFGEYRHPSGRVGSFHLGDDLSGAIHELRQLFRDAEKPVWGRVVFEMSAEGEFHCHWSYDDCDERGNRRWNAEEWAKMQEERSKRITM